MQTRVIFTVATVLASQVAAAIPGNTLADCEAFAATFANTCSSTSTAVTLSSHAGADLECTGNSVRCPGGDGAKNYTDQDPCKFTRKLCVTCRQSGSDVMIKVQGNGLPNHCVNSTVNNAEAKENEWEVVFQPQVKDKLNYQATDIDSSAKTDAILCDIQRTSSDNMLAESKYALVSGGNKQTLQTSSGIALSGMYIYNSLAAGNLDAVEGEIKTLDACLCHPTPFGEIHYHYWSPCIKAGAGFADAKVAPALCKDAAGCTTGTPDFVRTGSSGGQDAAYKDTTNNGGMLGLARDGHIIVGPYNGSGSSWTCSEHDVCNGAFVDNQYVYVSTSEFPYVVGCWGPATTQTHKATCSTNNCPSTAASTTDDSTTGSTTDTSGTGGVTTNVVNKDGAYTLAFGAVAALSGALAF